MSPTDAEIAAELARLEALKPKILACFVAGEDHAAAIDAQIHVLRDQMLEDEVYDEWYCGTPDAVLQAALRALSWLDMSTDEPPSEAWETLVAPMVAYRDHNQSGSL